MHNKKSEQGSVNITKITLPELSDLLDRQNNLLKNTKFIVKLPDQGEKIKQFKQKIENEIEARNSLSDTCELMSKMVLNQLPNEIEWSGKNAINKKNDHNSLIDSDDETDPLKLVATHSGTIKSYTKKVEKPDESLVTSKDLEDAKSFKSSPASYRDKLCKKYDQHLNSDRFKPHEPRQKDLAKDGFKCSSEHVREKMGKNWEITAATPPIPIHGSTGMVSLADSLLLQEEHARRVMEIHFNDAMTRLKETSSDFVDYDSCLLSRNRMKYREPTDPTVLFEGTPVSSQYEDKTAEDEIPESDGAVIYNIVDEILEQ